MGDYDTDILEWSERQAELLRRYAAGEQINEAELDWSQHRRGDRGRGAEPNGTRLNRI